LDNDSDTDSDALTVQIVTGPSHGTLSQTSEGRWQYSPDQNYHGTDRFTYRTHDGTVASTTAAVDLNVRSVNDRPVARADQLQVVEDRTLTLTAATLLQNDTDPDGDALTVRIVDGPSHGTLRQTANDRWEYVPDPNYHGEDRFTYRVHDGTTSSTVESVDIDVRPANDRPKAVRDVFRMVEDQKLVLDPDDLLRNDTDADRDDLRIQLVDDPQHGTVLQTARGKIVYTPRAQFHGNDRFGYRVWDDEGGSSVVAVVVRVTPENDTPKAHDDLFRTRQDSPLRVNVGEGVLQNDRDADGDSLRVRLLKGPSHGTLDLHANGSFVYRPAQGYRGPDSFSYVAFDQDGAKSVGDVDLRVAPVNAQPADPSRLTAPLTPILRTGVAGPRDIGNTSLFASLMRRWLRDR
jgi:VCBS repeat-containing protein